MNIQQAGLILMTGLSYMDGKMDESEMEKIAEFAAQNLSADVDTAKAIFKMMSDASGEDTIKSMLVAGAYIGAKASTESKTTMLKFLLELAEADGEVHANEIAVISQLKEAWL